MQERKIPVAALQTLAHDRANFERRWPHIEALVEDAATRGAKLIVLPEGTVPGYVLGNEPVSLEQLERAARGLAALARRFEATIVYGGARLVEGRTFNAAIVIGPDGRELGYAAKQFLWHFDRRWYAPGETLEPIDTPAGRLGLLVCADGRIPSIAATLAERGAEILVMPTAWVTSGRDPNALENVQADLMINVRARENALPFVVANKAGFELESVAYCGKSALVDATGAFVARAGERTEEIVFGELDLARGAAVATGSLAPPPAPPAAPPRARIAFTLASTPEHVARLAGTAAFADADLLIAGSKAPGTSAPPILAVTADDVGSIRTAAGLRFGIVDDAILHAPRGLVAARLAGLDAFIWLTTSVDAAWNVPFGRTRAAELRAFVIVLDMRHDRAFAVDPDGALVAGTFEGFRMASFVYDPARAAATTVAPTTDVFAGLRTADAIRDRSLATLAGSERA